LAGDLRALNEALGRFRALGVDPAEFACLKAIALFRSGKLAFPLVFFTHWVWLCPEGGFTLRHLISGRERILVERDV